MVLVSNLKKTLLFITLSSFIKSSIALEQFITCINNGDIALTFDDGPSLDYTSRILDILDYEDVKATFFVNGMNTCDLKNNQVARDIIKREYESGHVIASHTYSHPLTGITPLGEKKLTFEINALNNILYDIVGVKPAFFRPPLGEYTPENAIVLENCGITANILWNLDSEDWNSQYNATQQYVDILGTSDPSVSSFITLNHDIQEVTAMQNLPIVIPYIKSLGYRFVTMDVCTGMSAYQDGSNPPKVSTNSTSYKKGNNPYIPITSNLNSNGNTYGNTYGMSNNMNSYDAVNNEGITFDLEAGGAIHSHSFGLFALSFLFIIFYLI
ncbi:glycoside hydrolase/deacetylase [Piromyces finnis]|uniref:Glycoside hydrolase/deacetylase n=1 Tax=Piromyces finnis TaxID=1754191 RepID=A0A1Y1VMX1_9FUNG|nr:glycoside hydrolase/deacetylase [Piromyces finnis]|eukprot:ORX60786.1 glycoside hydrolase/deacetylase [Piromyces finnis]